MLLDHVLGLEQRAGEHELPAEAERLGLDTVDVYFLRIVDYGNVAAGLDQLDNGREMTLGAVERGDIAGSDAKLLHLRNQRLPVVDHHIGPHFSHPVDSVLTRGGGDDGEVGQFLGQLDEDRADTAGCADDEQTLSLAFAFLDPETVEEDLPGGDGGQRQACCFGKAKGLRFHADNSLIDSVELGVGAGAGQIT